MGGHHRYTQLDLIGTPVYLRVFFKFLSSWRLLKSRRRYVGRTRGGGGGGESLGHALSEKKTFNN